MILVTGAAGFIGSHLINYLIQDGRKDIIGIDNLSLGNIENISQAMKNGCQFLVMDAQDPGIEAVFEKYQFETVYHLAANSDIQKGSRKLSIDLEDTFLSTFYLVQHAAKYKVKNFFFTSSSAIYGNVAGVDLKETYCSLKPISFYGAAKLSSEAYLSAFSYMFDLDICVLRLPNVVGARMTHGVVLDFITKLKEKPTRLDILGNGQQKKPFIYIDDLILAIPLALRNTKGFTVYNVSGKDRITVKEIADIICAKMGLENVKYVYSGGKVGWKGDIPQYRYNATKIKNLGWVPKYDSTSAVKKAVSDLLEKGE